MVTPQAVKRLAEEGHEVLVEAGAGAGVHISDENYTAAGAAIMANPRELYKRADMIIKLKAPSPEEFTLMEGAILFAMLHSEQNPEHIYYAGLQKLIVVEMESIRDKKNERLINQTDITGEAGVHYALRHSLKMPWDMKALILGYGNVSTGAITACHKLGMETKILRKSEIRYVESHLPETDLLINGIAWPDRARSKREYVVTREHIQESNEGMVILDLSVDFPNPIETIHPTSYSQPYYLEEERVHVSLYGYPGLVPITSTRIYSEQVLPMALLIANNNGLRGIGNRGDLGAAIKKAIRDPKKLEWEQHKPSDEPTGSKIE